MSMKKGYTLVEVIVSLAVLGIISVGFLGAISSHVSYLNNTKVITKDALLAQREMEEEIDLVKDTIRNDPSSLTMSTIDVFDQLVTGGIEVSYYELEKTYGSKVYNTLVSDVKPEILLPTALESIDIAVKQGTDDVNYGYATGDFSVEGSFKNDNAYRFDHLLNVVEWYVSVEKFNIPFPKDPNFDMEDDITYYSYYYPLFPRDYILVSDEIINSFGSHSRTFSRLSDYAGRHIVFTATPGAKSGKIGIQSVSNSVFISGLPVTENLAVHFDAAFIDPTDTSEVNNSFIPAKVIKWNDLSSIMGYTSPTESAATYDSFVKPSLNKTEMDQKYIGQFVRFETNQYIKIENQSTDTKNIYIFAVVRNRITDQNSAYMKNGSKEFIVPGGIAADATSWIIAKEAVKSDDNSFVVGGPNVDVAEIIIYEGELITDKIDDVEGYLNSKYISPAKIGDIESIDNIDVTINVGESYSLPDAVSAMMSLGYVKDVAVKWSGTYDTDAAGTYTLTGTALVDQNKTMTLTLNVE